MNLRQRVLELARTYRRAQAPLTPARLVDGVGVRLAYGRLPEGRFGAWMPEQNLILLDPQAPPRRQRFTLAHEVMHLLIQQDHDLLSELHEAYAGGELERELEALCNLGAAEMLLPGEVVDAAIARRGQSPRLVLELAEQHKVSEEVAIIAMAERGPVPSLVLVAGGRPLRVYFSARHPRIPDRLPRGLGFRRDDPLVVAVETGLPQKAASRLPNHSQPYWLEAYPKGGRVYGVYKAQLGGGGL
ncbi:MAG: ImmA/IrrE family metallo-endopeptidase [Meiothermus sp.]|uniref:ImmA/IrrE family metallo-endopeptidase n=1 Tax=Meiothermus sp. TaxID=1955249 RepID=UPI0025E35F13|nr:ImmA/IrrE family metallo-endopeptidase [Meiothermus sp.]MCS7057784.1 ImmA/IrrE family metallo-endopeptidase [Meiothermus sp.]MCS7194627.1 ImmA/IrrE family metallo-endopeptidase [Meiothermus sp.]MCX7740816.1 ImmA/IrrE family metallo-endopeptidase [Meiothermus sp.]MDW8090964.1 ImmA/IrrE family metallo-endopeptidase [Meiothermus sp.]MDW8481858.1 ImmA/IrrE family metallo-endopeptidase [Meiothermus sp.]